MSKRKQFRAMDEQEMLDQQDPMQESLDYFFAEGLISEILYEVKRGKEATVYCCQAYPSTGKELVAVKIYRPRNERRFKNDAIYREGQVITNGQMHRAVKNKSRFGRQVQFGMWVDHEFKVLTDLYHAGADVPQPIAHTQSAILMEYFGDREKAARSLQGCELSQKDARVVFNRLLHNIELWLAHNYIHGDLSGYNILYWQQQARIIDFPQASDPRFNPNALFLLTRDVERICQWAENYGLEYDGRGIAEHIWHKFRNARL